MIQFRYFTREFIEIHLERILTHLNYIFELI